MGSALMVVRTAADVVAAADVLRAGHRLAVLAEPGHLYGPELPVRLDEPATPSKKSTPAATGFWTTPC